LARMKSFFRLIIALLSIIFSAEHAVAKVLVIGGTGRVGSGVVANLLAKGISTNVLVRDVEAAQLNEKLSGAQLFQGDVSSTRSLIEASVDCDAVIDVHGNRPKRMTKLQDLVYLPRQDINHPYNVNFLATKRIIAAMEVNRVKKMVRVTGALVGSNAFNPFTVLFNFLLSKSNKWNEMAEKFIRESGCDYTVVRPVGIRDTVSEPENRSLILLPADKGESFKVPAQLTTASVSDICTLAATDDRLSRSTVICSSEVMPTGKNKTQEWSALIGARQDWKDSKAIRPGRHNLALLLYTGLTASVVSGAARLIVKMVRVLMRTASKAP